MYRNNHTSHEYLLFEMVFSASPLVVLQYLLFENGFVAPSCIETLRLVQPRSNTRFIWMIFAISSISKLIFMHLGSVELMGLLTNIFYLKTNLVEPSGWPDEILSSIWNMFFNTPRISSIWKKNGFLIIFYLKRGLTDNPLIKKAKKPMVFSSFSLTPPSMAAVPK